ncbi:TetR/AcrR family transcriptional regulator [Paractinoplanes rhizophilus]|jgi:AcrR family transcriptional regulator|uniref:TetR/AcrR family transcriptional regulator n=1 Tax=Paractinoplanes rhizophilus TaxID=1416877 RepID=A0ABW2HQY3_9ACTN|nr:TetR/AcrR family transcriptional regulator [Actinoplanes sp.]
MPSKPDFVHGSVWMRPPRARGGQPALSREQIVRAAIELLDAEGAAGLSMRRLGSSLSAGATSLYWHVANKDELLELALDEVLGEVYVPEPADAPWRVSVTVFANSLRATLLRHPWMIGLLGNKPTLGPNAMRMGDRLVALLTEAGFTGFAMSHVSSLLHAHAIGSATIEAAIAAGFGRDNVTPSEVLREIEPYLDKIGPEHPHYDQWRRANPVTDLDPRQLWDEGFAFGLERIVDGLEHWLVAGGPPTPAPHPAADKT